MAAREICLLTNPTAGRGRGAEHRRAVLPRLEQAGFAVRDVIARDAGHARTAAAEAVADGVESVVVVGGDGLVHAVLPALAGTAAALGVVPAGSGNDVARYLDLPRRDPVAAADRVVASRRRRIDLARSSAGWFVTVLAAGFDAIVNERANSMRWPRGQMRYNLATLAELRTFAPIDYTLVLDGRETRVDAVLVAVGNGPSFGGGLRITEGARLDDGLLDVVVIRPMGRAAMLRTYPRLFRGTHTTHPQYEHHRVTRVTVAAPGIVGYADGERYGALPLTIEAVPGALEVIA